MVTALFPLIATQHGGLSKGETSVIFSLSTLVVIFAGPFFGWFSDHVSRKIVVSIRAICNAFSSVLYALTPGFIGLTTARMIDDTGKAAFRPAWGSMIAEISGSANKKKRGLMVSYLDTSHSIGEALGPVLAGWLWDWKGIYLMLTVRFILSLLTEIYTVWLLHYKRRVSFYTPSGSPS